MSLRKQAKILSDAQIAVALAAIAQHRYPDRDRVMFLLSIRAGLRAKEIAMVTWSMVTTSDGLIGDSIALEDRASKGRHGGRTIPMHGELHHALAQLYRGQDGVARIIKSERSKGLSPVAVQIWFHRLYQRLGFVGASSHSGRRTFLTRAARAIARAGGSLRDVQELAGHASLTTTQRYIEADSDAKRKVVAMIG